MRLTGKLKYRKSFLGKLILQVEVNTQRYSSTEPGGIDYYKTFRDATFEDLYCLEREHNKAEITGSTDINVQLYEMY